MHFISGNKIDREDREIPTEVGEEFAQRHGMYFLETSAKASDNVERLFTEIAQDLLQVILYFFSSIDWNVKLAGIINHEVELVLGSLFNLEGLDNLLFSWNQFYHSLMELLNQEWIVDQLHGSMVS